MEKERFRLSALEAKDRELEAAYEEAWQEHEACERRAEEARARLQRAKEAVEPSQALLLEHLQAESRLASEAAGLEARRRALEVRLQNLEKDLSEDARELERVKEAWLDHSRVREELKEALQEALRQRAQLTNEVTRAAESLHRVEDELAYLQEDLRQRQALLGSLEAIQRSFEGYRDGVRYLMEHRGESAELGGIRAVVAELLECPSDYELAIEAALGERIQSLVVETHADARAAIEMLRGKEAGRGLFIPLRPRNGETPEDLPKAPGLIGRALEMVSFREEYRSVLEQLLGGVWLVEDFDRALEIWRANGQRVTLVTLDGIVLEPNGLVVGGSVENGHLELLRKRRLIKELSAEVSALKERLEGVEAERGRLRENHRALEAEREAAGGRIGDIERRLLETEKTLEHLERERERIGRSLEVAEAEMAVVGGQLEEIREEESRLAGELSKAQAERTRHESLVAEAERAVEEASSLWEEAREALHDQALTIAQLRGQKEANRAEREATAERLSDLSGRLDAAKLRLEELARRQAELDSSLEAVQREVQERSRQQEELTERLRELEEALARHLSVMEQAEEMVVQSRSRLEEARERLSELEVRRAELRVEISHIEEQLERHWQLTTEELPSYYDPGGPSAEELRRQADEIREKLRRLGAVNLEATEEFEEVQARYEFLSGQKADLERSIADLRAAIEKINRTTRRLLKDSFEAINARFQEVFSRLFDGGSARLTLTDEDILKAGVEIAVQPPGKKLGSMTLLSAGEKALTALALLFAMFLVKPSPFCLLDEVDAALDDANTQRFTGLLKELAAQTQFIVITHNKQTMLHGDVLYGVTMEEEGVSRLVSLDLKQAEAHAR
jgi:chromosome segregation protein